MDRRAFLGAGVLAPFVSTGRVTLQAATSRQYSIRAIDLVTQSNAIDMLGLLTFDWDKLERWQTDPWTYSEVHFKRCSGSGIRVFHPAVELTWPNPRACAQRIFSNWNQFIDGQSSRFIRIDTVADLDRAGREGKVGVLLGMQNSEHLRKISDVTAFHAMGQRISQLTYNSRNRIGCGCLEHPDKGLTEYGLTLVRKMNETGMAIDVSHSGRRTTLDAIAASTRPVLITHSNCQTLVPGHPRCKSDEAIKAMARAGGVMGVTGIRVFVRRRGTATLDHVLDHFDHVANLAGVEHVGVGSDTDVDGRGRQLDVPRLDHPLRIYDLTEGLIRRGYSNHDITLILGGNFRRALSEIW